MQERILKNTIISLLYKGRNRTFEPGEIKEAVFIMNLGGEILLKLNDGMLGP